MIDFVDAAEDIAAKLSEDADVQIVYATAELQPFSAQRKPDLLLKMKKGPLSGRNVFVDLFRLIDAKRSWPVSSHLIERKRFVEDYIAARISLYIVICNSTIDDFSARALTRQGIKVHNCPFEKDDILQAIKQWAL